MQIANSPHIPLTLKGIAANQHPAHASTTRPRDQDGDTDGSTSASVSNTTITPALSKTTQRGETLNVVT